MRRFSVICILLTFLLTSQHISRTWTGAALVKGELTNQFVCKHPFKPGHLVHSRAGDDNCTAADVALMMSCATTQFLRYADAKDEIFHPKRQRGKHLTVSRFSVTCEAMFPHLIHLALNGWDFTVFDKSNGSDNFTSDCTKYIADSPHTSATHRIVPIENLGEETFAYLRHISLGPAVYDEEVFAHELEWVWQRSNFRDLIKGGRGDRYVPFNRGVLRISENGWSSQLHLICAIEHLCTLLIDRCDNLLYTEISPNAQFAVPGEMLIKRPAFHWSFLLSIVNGTLDKTCGIQQCRISKYYAHVLERLWWSLADP